MPGARQSRATRAGVALLASLVASSAAWAAGLTARDWC